MISGLIFAVRFLIAQPESLDFTGEVGMQHLKGDQLIKAFLLGYQAPECKHRRLGDLAGGISPC